MLTRKLHQASTETNKLVYFLEKREWERCEELTSVLDKANDEVERLVDKAVTDVLDKLDSYLKEANGWANNEMDNKLTKRELKKAKTEAKRIESTIDKLYEIL